MIDPYDPPRPDGPSEDIPAPLFPGSWIDDEPGDWPHAWDWAKEHPE